MLSKFFMRAAVTAVALTGSTGAVSAENYRVLMMDYAFFPEISYVQDGDTITFVNMSGITRIVNARNNAWTTPELVDGAEATVAIEQGMQTTFITRVDGVGGNGLNTNGGTNGGTDVTDQTTGTETTGVTDEEEGTIIGKLNFAAPPAIATN